MFQRERLSQPFIPSGQRRKAAFMAFLPKSDHRVCKAELIRPKAVREHLFPGFLLQHLCNFPVQAPQRRTQMPSRRKSHKQHILRVCAVLLSVFPHIADSKGQILLRSRIPLGRHAVLQHKHHISPCLHETHHRIPLAAETHSLISASRTNDDRRPHLRNSCLFLKLRGQQKYRILSASPFTLQRPVLFAFPQRNASPRAPFCYIKDSMSRIQQLPRHLGKGLVPRTFQLPFRKRKRQGADALRKQSEIIFREKHA